MRGYRLPSELVLLLDDTDLAGELLTRTAKSLKGHFLVRVAHFEKDAAGLNVSHPLFNGAFTGTHTNAKRLLGQRTVRENLDPHFATTLDVAVNGNTRGFNLTVGDVGRLQSLMP